jgi:aspartate kinase
VGTLIVDTLGLDYPANQANHLPTVALIVQKYGGSSLASPRHIRGAAARIKATKASGNDMIVVVSAMGRMTDHLIRLAKRTVEFPPQRELDMLMTAGERVSMALLAMSLEGLGVPAISFTGSQSGIVTSSDHTEAKILTIRAHRIREELSKGRVVIIAGFQGVSLEKEITTLGRGGSDTTAVAMAAALGAESCEILTDVDGLFTADPRLVPRARLISHCSYDEALELSSLGAKMHWRSIELAKRFDVKVRIASSERSQVAGTILSLKGDSMEHTLIRGVASRDGYRFFKVASRLDRLLDLFRSRKVPLRFLSFSSDEVRFLCEEEKAPLVAKLLRDLAPVEEEEKVSIVSVVGDGLASSSDVIPEVLEAIHFAGAPCFLICSNTLSVTAAVPSSYKAEIVRRLHERLVADKKEEPPGKGAPMFEGEALR